ncbi:MAG: hypothetical protein HY021_09990 [Burkholderiales bacterium]|nr:hypothetical protein [Burkholderiales bacterium]
MKIPIAPLELIHHLCLALPRWISAGAGMTTMCHALLLALMTSIGL